jgi:hypothetical protein
MGNFMIRTIVRILNKFWGPEPSLTSRGRYMAYRGRFYSNHDDYATRARNLYGDDQY